MSTTSKLFLIGKANRNHKTQVRLDLDSSVINPRSSKVNLFIRKVKHFLWSELFLHFCWPAPDTSLLAQSWLGSGPRGQVTSDNTS